MSRSNFPTEVELVFETMPCFALRSLQGTADAPHPCCYFGKWGTYHSYDYVDERPPTTHDLRQDLSYIGRAKLVPEMLSGCRKAPILAVGINPNLPGYWPARKGSLNPVFDDYRQFAHYFRYRSVAKLQLSHDDYVRYGGGSQDNPFSNFTLNVPVDEHGQRPIEAQLQAQEMYVNYQGLLETLADQMGWANHKLALGEDLVYGNMVACPSAKWTTRPDPQDPNLPPMTNDERTGIVTECFRKRRYFLRQLFQSLPQVILVFSQNTADAFIGELKDRLTEGVAPRDPLSELMTKPIRLVYGTLDDGTVLDARVIFSPHITGNPQQFAQARDHVVAQLVEQARNGRLQLNSASGHLTRTRGACTFCPMLEIGTCDYANEIVELTRPPELMAGGGPIDPLADKDLQSHLLGDLGQTSPSSEVGWAVSDEPTTALEGPSLLTDAAELPADLTFQPFPVPGFLAGEVDEDISPTFILKGRIATMDQNARVIDGGRLLVSQGRISAVLGPNDVLPTEFASALTIDTRGTIYPGLMDLHNHFVYNVLPLWQIPRLYTNRGQWQKATAYRSNVSTVMKVLTRSSVASRAIIRYIEAKALIGGTTTGQGILTQIRGNRSLFQGSMRNVESTKDIRLPEARTHVPSFRTQADIDGFNRAMDNRQAYFYHLAEGVDDSARDTYQFLVDNDLIQRYLVGIHSLGARADGLKKLADAGARVVWSPFSNMLLYGQTLDLHVLKDSSVTFSLGCDWAPTGSRNLLEELKVASFESKRQGDVFTSLELVRSVTSNAALVVGWQQYLGSIEKGKLADLVVIAGDTDDPYDALIKARETDVLLVMVHGVARHGIPDFVKALNPFVGKPVERVTLGGKEFALNVTAPASGLDDLSFAIARSTLADALGDLPAFAEQVEAESARLQALGIDESALFSLELDNELEDAPEELQAVNLSEAEFLAEVSMPDHVDLDGIIVGGDSYWQTVLAEPNLPDGLGQHLKDAYA